MLLDHLLERDDMLNTIKGLFISLFTAIIGFLPRSPFRQFVDIVGTIPYLDNLNWFVPVSEIIIVLEVWLSAVIIYYTYSAIMRFIRLL